MVEHVVSVPDIGDTRAELVAFVDGAVRILGSTLMGRVMQGLVSDLAADPELAAAFRERVVAARVAEVRRLALRGIERGDLRAETDLELLHELLFGPIYYRLLLSGAPLEDGLAERVVDAVLPAFVAPSPRRSRPRRGRRPRAGRRARAAPPARSRARWRSASRRSQVFFGSSGPCR